MPGTYQPHAPILLFAEVTALLLESQLVFTSVQLGDTKYFTAPPQHQKNPLQSTIFPIHVVPISVQHRQTAAAFEQLGFPQLSAIRALYCSEDFHIPEGTVRVHTVHEQLQHILQQGHEQKEHLQPRHSG